MMLKGFKQLTLACVVSMLLLFFLDAIPTQLSATKEQFATVWAGGDVIIKSPRVIDIPDEKAIKASSQSIKMSTMMLIGDEAKLVHLQLIDDAYPLYGELKGTIGSIPTNGIWVAKSFAQQSQIKLGDKLGIGSQYFEVAGFVERQDEQVFDFEAFSPSVFIRIEEADSLGLITNTSRLNHYIYMQTDDDKGLRKKLEEALPKDIRFIQPSESLGRVERVISEVFTILWVIRLVGYLMAGFLIHLALEYVSRMACRPLGVQMVLGFNRFKRAKVLLKPLSRTYFLGICIALILLVPMIFVINTALPILPVPLSIQWGSVLKTTLTSFSAIYIVLGILHATSLLTMPALGLLKKGPRSINVVMTLLFLSGVAVYSLALDWSLMKVLKNTLWLTSLGIILFLSLWGMFVVIKDLLARGHIRSYLLLNNLRLYQYEYTFVVLFMSVILSVGVLIWHAQSQLIPAWQAKLPQDADNGFFIGIQPREVKPLQQDFEWLSQSTFYPVIKGRLTDVSGVMFQQYAGGKYRDHEVFNRQLNLTELDTLPEGNEVITGTWGEGISAEAGIMRRLGLSLGDELTFLIYGEEVTGKITSVRQVNWDSMRLNFYFIFQPPTLSKYPASYMTTSYLTNEDKRSLAKLQQSYPGVTHLDVSLFVEQASLLIGSIVNSLNGFLGLVLLFGIVAFFLLLSRQKQQKRHQIRSMNRLGLSQKIYPVLKDELLCILSLSIIVAYSIAFFAISKINAQFAIKWYFDPTSLWLSIVPLMSIFPFVAIFKDRSNRVGR